MRWGVEYHVVVVGTDEITETLSIYTQYNIQHNLQTIQNTPCIALHCGSIENQKKVHHFSWRRKIAG